jgi:hypothetical protein
MAFNPGISTMSTNIVLLTARSRNVAFYPGISTIRRPLCWPWEIWLEALMEIRRQ